MNIDTYTAKCASCHSEFPYPELGDFAYGEFLFTGERGNVFAHFRALDHPVWDFAAAVLPGPAVTEDDLRERGPRIEAACAYVADRVEGQRLVSEQVCPICRSTEWAWWEGERVGSLEVPEATFSRFLSLSEPERRRVVLEFDARSA